MTIFNYTFQFYSFPKSAEDELMFYGNVPEKASVICSLGANTDEVVTPDMMREAVHSDIMKDTDLVNGLVTGDTKVACKVTKKVGIMKDTEIFILY